MFQSIRDNSRGELSNSTALLFLHIINILRLAYKNQVVKYKQFSVEKLCA